MTLSENTKHYFQYLKCGLNREKIKYNAYLYILSFILIGQFFLLSLYIFFLYRSSKIKIKVNPPKKEIEKNFSLDEIDTEKKKIKIFPKSKDTDAKIKTNEDKNSQITMIDNITKKEEKENSFCNSYKYYILSKFSICILKDKKKLGIIENLNQILFMIILFTYICSISFDQNYISDKYFSNNNQILFIIKNQYIFIIISALVVLILDFIFSYFISSSKKVKSNKIYILIVKILFSIFLSYSIIVFCSIYPKITLDLFIQFVIFTVIYYFLKLILLSLLFTIYYYNKLKK